MNTHFKTTDQLGGRYSKENETLDSFSRHRLYVVHLNACTKIYFVFFLFS